LASAVFKERRCISLSARSHVLIPKRSQGSQTSNDLPSGPLHSLPPTTLAKAKISASAGITSHLINRHLRGNYFVQILPQYANRCEQTKKEKKEKIFFVFLQKIE
jgi:hypothetical protein